MPQDNLPEQEQQRTENREQRTGEEAAEKRPDFEVQKQGTEDREQRTDKPEIPESTKPQLPQEEAIPTGGPGDQQAQATQTTPQTKEEKIKKIRAHLAKPIAINTPKERKESSQIEDEHNQDILDQP